MCMWVYYNMHKRKSKCKGMRKNWVQVWVMIGDIKPIASLIVSDFFFFSGMMVLAKKYLNIFSTEWKN